MKKLINRIGGGLMTGRYNLVIACLMVMAVMVLMPQTAWAQTNPFDTAGTAAGEVRDSLKTFALTIGGIGMISCLLLGFFGKLNWKWVTTGIGVSFAIAIVVPAINWLSTLG